MHFAIRFLTEYRYDAPVTDNLNALRVRPATTSTQRCDEFHTRIEPEARVSRHLDYFGTEVLEFGIPTSHEQLTIDVRARVVTSSPAGPAGRARGRACAAPSYVDAAGEFALPWQDQPALAGLESLDEALESRQSTGDARTAVRDDPRPLRVPPGRDICGLEHSRPARSRRGCVPGLRAPVAGAAAPSWHRRALRLRLSVGGPRGSTARTRSRSTRTRGSRHCCLAATAAVSQCGSAPTRPTAASRARRT